MGWRHEPRTTLDVCEFLARGPCSHLSGDGGASAILHAQLGYCMCRCQLDGLGGHLILLQEPTGEAGQLGL